MPEIVYVILAAGGSRRMGFAKATAPLAGTSPIERLGVLLEGRAVAIVTSKQVAPACALAIPRATVLVNEMPLAGMTSSLLVAHHAIDPEAILGVLLADKPFVTRETLELCERAFDATHPCDVGFAVVAGERGHPVYFGPAARARLAALPAGDTLRALRDDPNLVQVAIECNDAGVLIDLDTPEAWNAAERRLLDERERDPEEHLPA